jgi:Zn-dependent peptidase ImmA (M78 family)
MEVLELARNKIPDAQGLEIVVRPNESMGRASAFAKSREREIFVRQSILEGALADSDESRFVLLHELVHVIAHSGPRRFRIAGGNKSMAYIGDHESAEWQANRVTRAVFMPPAMVRSARFAGELARNAGVPLKEAVARIQELNVGKARPLAPSLSLEIARAKALGAASSGRKSQAQFEVLKLELWNALPVIQGEPPQEKRLCGIYQIWWVEYGKATQCGWYIEARTIVSYFAARHG